MPLRLDIKRKLQARSERVKCVDIHPKEPWILVALYLGNVHLQNYESESLEKTFEITESSGTPVRAAKFIVRKQWFVSGSDDMMLRIFNYNTMEKIRSQDAHNDYIRSIGIHPTLPYILSASDDMTIKLQDQEKDFTNTMIFEGHTHYVMHLEINPIDPQTFATASLDRTIKVWGIASSSHHFSLEGHDRGVNCVGYLSSSERPFLVSGGDDHLVKVWDFQAKSCVATLNGHTGNISAVIFHPILPIIISGSEDGTLRIQHSTTYRLENTLDYGLERAQTIAAHHSSNKIAIGYDEGTLLLQLGHDEPVMSMDTSGNLVQVRNHEIMFSNVKSMLMNIGNDICSDKQIVDGDILPLSSKSIGNCEIYPQSLQHSSNGRVLCICGDGEYTIYTARKLKNMSFGNAVEFVQSNDSKMFAIRENNSTVKIFHNYKEVKSFRPKFSMEGIFGGVLLAIRSTQFVDFYDWHSGQIIRRILVCPSQIYQSENGSKVAIASSESCYILAYDSELVKRYLNEKVEIDSQGIDRAFQHYQEIHEKITTGYFAGNYCFIYTNGAGRLKYYVGDQPEKGEIITIALFDRPLYLLGYILNKNRIYLMDRDYQVVSYTFLVDILLFQIEVVSSNFDKARDLLKKIPIEHHNKLARFLEAQNLKEMSLEVSNDPEHKFDLACQLGRLDLAEEILTNIDCATIEEKWRQLGDISLKNFDLELAEKCAIKSKDLGLLLLIYSSKGDKKGIERLLNLSLDKKVYNIAFLCYFYLNRLVDAIDLLVETDRISEAAFLARTYAPSQIDRIVKIWQKRIQKTSKSRTSKHICSPEYNSEMFQDLDLALEAEKWVNYQHKKQSFFPATEYLNCKSEKSLSILEDIKTGKIDINKQFSDSSNLESSAKSNSDDSVLSFNEKMKQPDLSNNHSFAKDFKDKYLNQNLDDEVFDKMLNNQHEKTKFNRPLNDFNKNLEYILDDEVLNDENTLNESNDISNEIGTASINNDESFDDNLKEIGGMSESFFDSSMADTINSMKEDLEI